MVNVLALLIGVNSQLMSKKYGKLSYCFGALLWQIWDIPIGDYIFSVDTNREEHLLVNHLAER